MGCFSISCSQSCKILQSLLHCLPNCAVHCRYPDDVDSFVTAAVHALILFIFYLHSTVVWVALDWMLFYQNSFIIKNKQQDPNTSSKQQEKHNKYKVLITL